MTKIGILGCGLTGMMQAIALADHGIASTIIERTASDYFPHDIRTTAFTRHVQKFLCKVGIWSLFTEEEIGPISDIYVVDNKSPRVLHMGNKDIDVKAMGYIIENDVLKKKLYTSVQKNPLITLVKGFDYDVPHDLSNSIILQSQDKKMAFDLVLVCDGRGSKLKELFEHKVNKSYGQSAIVLIAEHSVPHEQVAVEHFLKTGPFATLPMYNPYHSSVVWTEKTAIADLYGKMDKAKLELHLQERFGEFLGKVKIVSDVQIFPLTATMVKNYFQGNVVLVGDVAHAIHPLAGQGLNQGIKDIESITNIIVKRIKNGLELDQVALREYEKSRSRDNWSMYLITDNINRVFSNDFKILSIWRKFGLAALNEMETLKHKLASYGTGNN